MDAVAAKLRDKRNRVLERETNELKDELCAMRHIVHLLDNIKRVSSDCIQYLHLMVDAAMRTDNNQLDQLRDDVQELEEELKAWERKYQMMSQMQNTPPKTDIINLSKTAVNNVLNNSSICHNIASDHTEHSTDHLDHSANGSFYDSDRNEDCAQSSSHNSLVLMPQELCEMSMETNDNEPVVITSSNASPQPPLQITVSPQIPSLLPAGLQDLSSGKSLFECDWVGCDFRTNMRQRLVMHKRLHAGEMLFSCDVPGCGYQSNYKGNIKIHKKHRHRLETDENKEYSSHPIDSVESVAINPNTNSIHTASHSPNLSHHLTKNNNISSNLIRKRKRKKKFRYTVNRTNSAIKPTVVGGQSVREEDRLNAQSPKAERISNLFACTVKGCNYRSKWKQCLTAHQLLHAGVKPFKCDHPGCNYRTNFKGNVNVHKRVHRESQYQCQVNGCQFSTPWKNSFNQHQRNHLINNSETTLNIDNHIEVQSEDNEYEEDGLDQDENSLTERLPAQVSVHRNVLKTVSSMPVLPVHHIQNLSTNDLMAAQRNSGSNSMQTNAQPFVPPLVSPLVGVIKSIKTEI